MPRIGLYVSAADKAYLDALPPGVTGAAIFREALRQARLAVESCPHPVEMLELACRRCGSLLDTDLMATTDADPVDIPGGPAEPSAGESPAQGDADPVCI
jgi:hypothetical protein